MKRESTSSTTYILKPLFCCFPFTNSKKSKIEKREKGIGSEKRIHAESVPLN